MTSLVSPLQFCCLLWCQPNFSSSIFASKNSFVLFASFSTVTGYIISHCPYKSPASTVAQVIADNVLHPLNLLYSFVHPLAAVASFVGIFSVNNGQNLTILFSGFGCFIISAWLIVRFSRRSRIPKVWRIWQTLLLSLGLSAFLYTCIILLSRTWSGEIYYLNTHISQFIDIMLRQMIRRGSFL